MAEKQQIAGLNNSEEIFVLFCLNYDILPFFDMFCLAAADVSRFNFLFYDFCFFTVYLLSLSPLPHPLCSPTPPPSSSVWSVG